MTTLILFIVIFGLVVISHEFGHFLLAKANGIHVVEFSVGMGPTLLHFTKGDTKYSLKLLPIGGACMFEGEDGLATKEGEESEGSFLKAPVWGRISTVVAGPLFNFILAFIIALIMVNMVVLRDPIATEVLDGSAAMEAGLQDGDRILALDGDKVYLYEEIQMFTQLKYDGGDIKVTYERDGVKIDTVLTPKYDESAGRYMLGISNADFVELKGADGIKYAYYEIRKCVKMTYQSLAMMVQGKVERQDVAGPVGIANMVGETYEEAKEYGWQNVLVNMMNITMVLSVNLGILNLLPFPALDGGRLVFLLIEVLRGKPVPPEKEGMVHFVGLMFFMILMVFVLFNDISNVFFS